MGISNYIKMETLPYDVIHHIDMHMKLLDEETLLVSRYPSGVADGPQIEANIDYVLSNFQSVFGTPYDVKWIDAPPSTSGSYPDTGGYYRTFSNSLILNKTILVPTYRPEVDAAALAYYEELMPGYNIVGIDVDNPGKLRPEATISGKSHVETRLNAVMMPEMSVVRRPAGNTIYVINDNSAEARIVKTGHHRDGLVEIVSGLSGNEMVATDGAAFLTSGAKVKISETVN